MNVNKPQFVRAMPTSRPAPSAVPSPSQAKKEEEDEIGGQRPEQSNPGLPKGQNEAKHFPLHPVRSIRLDQRQDSFVMLYRIEETQMRRLISKCFGYPIDSCNLQQTELQRLEDYVKENIIRRAIENACF